jgi:hypothetical protein
MSLVPPVPIPPGQAVTFVYPTTAEARSADMGATNGTAVANIDPVTRDIDGSGLITMSASGPLGNWVWAIQWADFPAVVLPGHGTVSAIYAVVKASKTGANAFREAVTGTSPTPWNVSMGGTEVISNSTGVIDPSAQFASATLGSDSSIITSLKIAARLFSTANIPSFNDIFTIEGVGLAVYYTAQIMPIGHGANCNDYDPISLYDGSTSAPGNGLLIS